MPIVGNCAKIAEGPARAPPWSCSGPSIDYRARAPRGCCQQTSLAARFRKLRTQAKCQPRRECDHSENDRPRTLELAFRPHARIDPINRLQRHINLIHRTYICLFAGSLCVTGCARVPSINILGAFFPAWMVCIVSGIVLTLVLRMVLITAKVDEHVRPRGIIYPASTLLFTLVIWVVFFQN